MSMESMLQFRVNELEQQVKRMCIAYGERVEDRDFWKIKLPIKADEELLDRMTVVISSLIGNDKEYAVVAIDKDELDSRIVMPKRGDG